MSLYQKFMQDLMTVKASIPKKPVMGFCGQCQWNYDLAHNGQYDPAMIEAQDCEHCQDKRCILCSRTDTIHDGEDFICLSCHNEKWGVESE